MRYFPLTEDQQDKFEKEFHQAHMFRLRCSSENEYKYLKKRQGVNHLSDWQKGRLDDLETIRAMNKKIGGQS